ncbi:MAG: glycosyltransferase family 4 protein, partial [Salinimicrobium sp.]
VAHRLIYTYDRKDLYFVQIGHFDRETPKLQKKLQELKLEEHFAFYNFIDDASSYMPAFDVFALTSQSEGLPNVLYEAAYYKVPIVSTNVGGISEMLQHNESAFLAEAFNPLELAEHIISLLENKELAKQFTERAYNNLMNNFTTKQMAEKTLVEYKTILHGQL